MTKTNGGGARGGLKCIKEFTIVIKCEIKHWGTDQRIHSRSTYKDKNIDIQTNIYSKNTNK